MIHKLLLALDRALPLYPPLVVALAALLVIFLALWLFGKSRATIFFSIAAIILATGLAVGLFGLDKPASLPGRWGDAEDVAQDLIGPRAYRRWEQLTAAGLILSVGLLYVVYNMAFQEKPGERSRRLLELDQAQAKALGSAHLCGVRTFRRWHRHDAEGWSLQGRFWGQKASTWARDSASAARTSPAAWPSLARRARARPSASSCRPSPTGCATATA